MELCLTLRKVNQCSRSIRNNYLFTVIIVNERYEIIDGQHRFEVIKKFGLPLHYIICKGYGLQYREFKNEYKLGHKECQIILSGNDSKDLVNPFYKGEFVIKDYNNSVAFANKLLMIEPYYSGVRRRSFVTAFYSLMKNENFELTEFLQKLKQQPSALTDCVNATQYTVLIEEIYNYKRRIKVNLRY